MKRLVLSVLLLAACGESKERVEEVRSDRGSPGGAGGETASPSGGKGNTAGAPGVAGASGAGGVPSVDGGAGSAGTTDAGVGGAGTGTGGMVAASGAAGQPMMVSEPFPIGDGGFPLFVGEVGAQMASSGEDGSFHFVFAAETSVGNVSTHIHNIDLTELFTSVAFEVRASRPTTMFVASTPVIDSYDADQAAGFTWLGTEVLVSEEFTTHDVVFVDMLPIGEGEPRPLSDSGTAIHFLLFQPGDTELWLRNIELRP